jgi:hypothetical protein
MTAVTRWSLLLALLLGCGGDTDSGDGKGTTDGPSLGDGDGDDGPACVDTDGDGYGVDCDSGPDCDDNDDTIFEGCGSCTEVREGCACEAAEAVDCKIPTSEVRDGVLFCKTGKRYCRDGLWTACIGIAGFAD